MELEEYLSNIKHCPNKPAAVNLFGQERTAHTLTVKYGVYDNYLIFLNYDIDLLVNILKDIGYVVRREIEKNTPSYYGLSNTLQTVKLQVKNTLPFDILSYYHDSLKNHFEAQKGFFNTAISLHSSNISSKPNWEIEVAEEIMALCYYLKERNIPFCIPTSIGWEKYDQYGNLDLEKELVSFRGT